MQSQLAADAAADLIVAICDDKYRANYTRSYVNAHQPLLVLKINGQLPSGWPKALDGHGYDMGPFLISHPHFVPSYRILSHPKFRRFRGVSCVWSFEMRKKFSEQSLRGERTQRTSKCSRAMDWQSKTVSAAITWAKRADKSPGSMDDIGGDGGGFARLFADLHPPTRETQSSDKNGRLCGLRRCDHAGANRVFCDICSHGEKMTLRASKVLLIFALAFFYTLVVLNNTTDFDSNYQFVRHVMMMDTTFQGNRGMGAR